jgi:predicted DNA-binding transcriptional regulator AlpA
MALSVEDRRLAERLLAKLTAAHQAPEFVKAGELPDLFFCSRTKAWALTLDPTFPKPLVLGSRLRLWRRAAVIAWRDAHRADAVPEKKSPEPAGGRLGAFDPTAVPTTVNVHSSTTKSIRGDASARPKRKQAPRR